MLVQGKSKKPRCFDTLAPNVVVNDHKKLKVHTRNRLGFESWFIAHFVTHRLMFQKINKKQFKKPTDLYWVIEQNRVSGGDIPNVAYFFVVFLNFLNSFWAVVKIFPLFFNFLGRQMLAYVLGENKAIWKSFQQLTLIESLFFRIFEKFIHFENCWCQQFFFC